MNQFKRIIFTAVTVMVCLVLVSLGIIWIINLTRSNQIQHSKRQAYSNERQEEVIDNNWRLLRSIANNIPPLL